MVYYAARLQLGRHAPRTSRAWLCVMDVRGAYAGQAVLLTGGTGFLGKVLLERLLWELPAATRVRLLVRTAGRETPGGPREAPD